MIIVGVDPGITGGIVALNELGALAFRATMPAISGMMDIPVFASFFRSTLKGCHVFMEQAQSFPKQGVASAFNYGRGFGSLEGVLGSLGVPYTLVRPSVWTRDLYAGLTKELPAKEKALITVKRLFPALDLKASDRCKKQHEGLVDAILIAEYGRRQLG